MLALAPDSTSQVAGRKLATPKPWSDAGWADPLLWGSCQGSGKKPYTVAIDVSGPTYKCSCPSRKFPCKHVLGLLFLWAEGGIDAGGALSQFASDWTAKRARTDASTREKPKEKTEAQLAAAAERAAQREERVAAGVDELERWLVDQVSLGVAASSADGVDTMAARMIDAQAPGVAGRLRAIARVPRSKDWLEATVTEYGLLHLLCRATHATSATPGPLRDTVRMRLGFTTPREAVLSTPAVSDRWAVVGMHDSDEDQVSVRKVWLFGMTTGVPALVMFFTPRGQAVADSLLPGSAVKADLHFYPGQPRLRAAVASQADDGPAADWHPAGTGVATAIHQWRQGLAADPWLTEWPVVVTGTVGCGAPWTFGDADGQAVPLIGPDIWQLLAFTGGHESTVFGELSADGLRPTSVLLDDTVVPL